MNKINVSLIIIFALSLAAMRYKSLNDGYNVGYDEERANCVIRFLQLGLLSEAERALHAPQTK